VTLFLRVGARSHVGIVRDGNEDSLFAGHRLLAVADGVGGAAYGEVASATTIATLAPLDGEVADTLDDPLDALRRGVAAANARLHEMTEDDPRLTGMGTTLTALLWTRQRLALVQVGDSRAYRRRAGRLDQISHDQTFVQMLVDEGRITADQAASHPQRSVILNAIDGRDDVEAAVELLDPQPGDRYLVCSDGLSDYVSAGDIDGALEVEDPQEACDRLVDLALEAGAPDNVTCIVADVVDTEPEVDGRLPILGGAALDPATDDHPTSELHAVAAPVATPVAPDAPSRQAGRRHRGSSGIGRRLGIVIGIVVILVVAAVVGTVVYSRHQYYVAADGDSPTRNVAIYQGVHGHALGIGSHVKSTTDLPVTALPQDERQRVDGSGIGASSETAAQQVVANLRQDACALATTGTVTAASAAPTTSPSARPSTSARPTPSATPPDWCTP
jgi:PPM family protein phosphatase